MRTAEIESFAGVLMDVLRGCGVHVHPADGVSLNSGRRFGCAHVFAKGAPFGSPTMRFDTRCSILDSSGAVLSAIQHLTEGLWRMTYLDVVFSYGALPGERELQA